MDYKLIVKDCIEKGIIVCPYSFSKLVINGDQVVSDVSNVSYPFNQEVPELIDTAKQSEYFSENSGKMID